MTQYREYRGLYGEPVRVPERSVTKAPAIHRHKPFPFAAIAARLGKERDSFAHIALQVKLFDDLSRSRSYRAGRFRQAAA